MIVSLAWNYLAVSLGVGIAASIFLLLRKRLRSRYSAVSLSVVWVAMVCCLLFPVGNLLSAYGSQAKAPIEIAVPPPASAMAEPSAPIHQMKERLSHMLSLRNKKKGLALVSVSLIVTLLATTIFAFNLTGSASTLSGDAGSGYSLSGNGSDLQSGAASLADILSSYSDNAVGVQDISVMGNTDSITNILLLGVDRRRDYEGRPDCMIVLSINTSDRTINLTSLNRDIYVSIPDHNSNKLNAAYALGGFDLLRQTIAENFRIGIDKYIAVNFSAFTAAVDAMNGADLELTGAEAGLLHLGAQAGIYHLDGSAALAYSRIRRLDGDFGRTERQRKMLTALINRSKTIDPTALISIASAVIPGSKTNISASEWWNLISHTPDYLGYQISEYSVPQQKDYAEKTFKDVGSVLTLKNPKKSVLEMLHQIYD